MRKLRHPTFPFLLSVLLFACSPVRNNQPVPIVEGQQTPVASQPSSTSPTNATPPTLPNTPFVKRVGETFTITLSSNPTTGYKWGLQQPLNESIVQLESSEFQGSGAPCCGAGGQEIWKFKAVGQGETKIALKYFRSFEPADTPPVNQQVFTVQVN